jgi:aspartyl-tRNA(Asn)/glutamyl-tRNA(Gln) amidotransferase subunit A
MTPADLSAAELLAQYRSGQLSPVEATQAVLDRIAEADPAVNAFVLVDAERALAGARESAQRWRRGDPAGLLDGVPVSIKDVLLTRGWPTLRGSRTVDPGQDWAEDSPAVERIREQGAVLVGKTTTPELGWKGVTDSPLSGVTRNPWDPARTAGGSSGGGAAAVALGMAPLTLGTDGGGSVRIPAGFCGVFALKPTYGRVSHYPPSPFGTLAHTGPITSTVTDTALLMDVISAPDDRGWASAPAYHGSFVDSIGEASVAGLRIGFSADLGYVKVDPEVAEVVSRAVDGFAELGAHVSSVDPGFTDPVEEFHVLWFAGAAKSVAGMPEEQMSLLDPGLAEICALGEEFSAVQFVTAEVKRMELSRIMGRFHREYDLLLTPTLPIPAFEAGHEVPVGWPRPRWTSWTPFTYPFNMTQQPAASLPCGFTAAGLPVGLQVVGPRFADSRVLTACRAFEQAFPWVGRRPNR